MFKPVETERSGYQLYDLGSTYQLRSPKGIYTGSLKQVVTYAVIELGFQIKEIEIGILEMEKHFHNAAEYGIFKRFMWTYDLEEKNGTKTIKH